MKKIIFAVLALAFAGSAMAQNKNEKVTFYVNYHCEQCVKKVNKEMPFVKGVTNIKTDLKGKSIEVTYNPNRTDREKLRKALEKLDFVVKDSYAEIVNASPRDC